MRDQSCVLCYIYDICVVFIGVYVLGMYCVLPAVGFACLGWAVSDCVCVSRYIELVYIHRIDCV